MYEVHPDSGRRRIVQRRGADRGSVRHKDVGFVQESGIGPNGGLVLLGRIYDQTQLIDAVFVSGLFHLLIRVDIIIFVAVVIIIHPVRGGRESDLWWQRCLVASTVAIDQPCRSPTSLVRSS